MKYMIMFTIALAFNFASASNEVDALKQAMTENKQAIAALNKNLSCKNDSDCSSLPVGSRACGGPNGYIVVSLLNPNLNALKERTQLSSQLENEYNRVVGAISICSLEAQPDVSCVKNTCQEQ